VFNSPQYSNGSWKKGNRGRKRKKTRICFYFKHIFFDMSFDIGQIEVRKEAFFSLKKKKTGSCFLLKRKKDELD